MTIWDEEADGLTGYTVRYYCTVCEEFFFLDPIAPLRCPYCFGPQKQIIGPILAKEYDLNKLRQQHKDKYGKYNKR